MILKLGVGVVHGHIRSLKVIQTGTVGGRWTVIFDAFTLSSLAWNVIYAHFLNRDKSVAQCHLIPCSQTSLRRHGLTACSGRFIHSSWSDIALWWHEGLSATETGALVNLYSYWSLSVSCREAMLLQQQFRWWQGHRLHFTKNALYKFTVIIITVIILNWGHNLICSVPVVRCSCC